MKNGSERRIFLNLFILLSTIRKYLEGGINLKYCIIFNQKMIHIIL